MEDWKKIVGFFFFSALMFIKVSAFHVFTHHDEDAFHYENCAICEIALDNRQSVLMQPGAICFEPNTSEIPLELASEINKIGITSLKVHSFYSRPPPALLA